MAFGLMLPVVIGAAGLGVEVATWYETRAKANAVADLAAHAAGLEAMESADDDERIEAVALETAAVFGVNAHEMTAVPSQTDLGTRIDVEVNLKAKRYFSTIFAGSGDLDVAAISGSASAIVEASGEACLLALDPNGNGIEATGNNHTVLNGCLAMSNATASDALSLPNSNATLIAECGVAVGGASIHSGNSSEAQWSCAKARTGASPVADPYFGTPLPDLTSPPYDTVQSGSFGSGGGGGGKGKGKKSGGSSGGGSSIASGRYDQLHFSNTVLFEDGATVVIDGGDLSNQGPATLIGENVTIILMNGSEVSLTSQATLDLKAKTSGTYAGLLVMSDAATQGSALHNWRGGSATALQGAIYLPADTLQLRGGANTTVGCTHFIAGEISLSGNSRLSNECDGVGTLPLEVSGGVRLLASDE